MRSIRELAQTLSKSILAAMQQQFSHDRQLQKQVVVTLHGEPVDQQTLTISQMGLQTYLKYGESWKHKEKWSTLRDSMPANFSLDPQGFFVLYKENDANPIATVAAVKNEQKKVAYIGFYITRLDMRGRGYGWHLYEYVQADLERRGYVIGLNCFESMTPMYEKANFQKVTTDIVYKTETSPASSLSETGICVRNFADISDDRQLDALIAYDAKIFGNSRRNFLILMLSGEDTQCVVAYDDNQIKGYAISKERVLPPAKAGAGHAGSRVGPFYAENDRVAKVLLNEITRVSNLPVFMDTQMSYCSEVAAMLSQGVFSKVVSLDRCYRGRAPKPDSRVYGNTSLAFSHL